MKRIFLFALALAITAVFCLSPVAALDSGDDNHSISDGSGIELSIDKELSKAQINAIIAYFTNDAEVAPVPTRSWCWLVGHNIQHATVTAVRHCYFDTAPRCLKEVYDVASCTNCEFVEATVLTQVPIFCCN